jgi:hypothetical protein
MMVISEGNYVKNRALVVVVVVIVIVVVVWDVERQKKPIWLN